MTRIVEAVSTPQTMNPQASDILLRHCLALFGPRGERRAPARVRLEEALGPELARRLLSSLTTSS